jgi:hypothetical protein
MIKSQQQMLAFLFGTESERHTGAFSLRAA